MKKLVNRNDVKGDRISSNCLIARLLLVVTILSYSLTLLVNQTRPVLANTQVLNNQFQFDQLNIEHGLSQNTVLCLLQDRHGFMWFGTQDGLNKYDGQRFTVYRHDEVDEHTLLDNYILSLFEDRAGRLWVGTNKGGLSRYEPETETFTHFLHDAQNPHSLSLNTITAILEDANGMLWVGTDGGGLNHFDPRTNQATRYQSSPDNPQSLSHNIIRGMYQDRAGILWLGTAGGLSRFDPATKTFTRYQHDPLQPDSLSDKLVISIAEDDAGMLWLATSHGLNEFDRATGRFRRIFYQPGNDQSLNDNSVISVRRDHTGTIWVGTNLGLNRYEAETKQFRRAVNDPNAPTSLSNKRVLAIYEDRDGILWVSCQNGGLNRLDLRAKHFAHYFRDPKNPASLPYNSVQAFLTDRRGTTWIGTSQGLVQFKLATGSFTPFPLLAPTTPAERRNSIRTLVEDQAGNLWVGTSEGIYRIAADTKRVKHYFHQPEKTHSLSSNSVLTLLVDHEGTLWVGTHGGGLERFEASTETFTHFQKEPNNPASLSDNLVFQVYEDRGHTLWIATNEGLNRFDRRSGQFEKFLHDQRNPHSLSHSLIWTVYEDKAGRLWAGTAGGLNQFHRETRQFTHDTEKDGLPNNNVMGILEDERGQLWLSTAKGVTQFDPLTHAFRNYDNTDGLQGKEFEQGAYYQNQQGLMFFGGANGFNLFHPALVVPNTSPSNVVITACRRYNTDDAEGVFVTEKGIADRQAITLSYKNNIISFDFAVLSFRHPEKHQFSYQLAGYSDKWIPLGTTHQVTFTNLDPGNYTLHVKGANSDGVWQTTATSLRLMIVPPFWKRWWFMGLALLLLVGLCVSVFWWRVAILHKRNAQQQAVSQQLIELQEQDRKRIAAELHDSLGQQLLVIKNWAMIGLNLAKGDSQAREPLEEISTTASLAIDEVREVIYDLRPYQLDKIGLTNTLRFMIEKVSTAAELEIQTEFGAIDELFSYNEQVTLYRIVQECVNNIVRHAQASAARVVITPQGETVRVLVEDNGRGFAVAQRQGNGFGLQGLQERVRILKGELIIDAAPGLGTKIQIMIDRKHKQ